MTSRQVPTRARTWFRLTGWIALLLVCQQPVQGLAQAVSPDYRLRPGDEILISVPSRPELDRRLSLDATGRATIPQVGEVSLGGLTLEEAAEVLRQRLRLFYPAIDEVEVMPFTTAQIRIYVIGAVADSGQYQFTVLPTIWELLRAAGGPADEADLRHARVVRVVDGKTTVIPVDLSQVIESGRVADVALQGGDTLVVPALRVGVSAVPARLGVQVFGAVATPAVVPIEEPTELVDVLMLAGSPTVTADLKKVYWVRRLQAGFESTEVNVRQYLEQGDPVGNPLIYPGDTVEVPVTRPSWAAANLPLILGLLATTATIILAYDRLVND